MIRASTLNVGVATSSFKLSGKLTDFPRELFKIADTLNQLDLSGNQLADLPDDFWKFKNLRILFLSNNDFTVFPEVLGKMKNLDIVGFKANKIKTIPEDSIPENLRWLILTDNEINELPASIGKCTRLQKLMLAGNKLTRLPEEMANCKRLELLRISANQLEAIPSWLFELPKLAWLALAGNAFTRTLVSPNVLPKLDWNELSIGEQLGEGASGHIYSTTLGETHLATKVFKGTVTSDGWPADEVIACIHSAGQPNIVNAIAEVVNHPEKKLGLAFERIAVHFQNLGHPPSFETCTRDTFQSDVTFSVDQVKKIITANASALQHLHSRGIMHGDIYAHNILVNSEDDSILSDFGAATLYNRSDIELAAKLERIDVRAFGCLLDDLLLRIVDSNASHYTDLMSLRDACLHEVLLARPNFGKIYELLKNIKDEPTSIQERR
jgi:hypothetical protein